MNFRNIMTVYLKELKDSLRDRRTLISTIVIPTLVMPLMTFGVVRVASKVVSRAYEEKPRIMIIGGDDSPRVVDALKAVARFRIVPKEDDYETQIADKRLRAAVKIPSGFDRDLEVSAAAPIVVLHYQGDLNSKIAADELDKFFREYRDKQIAATLAARSLPPTLSKPFEIERQNVAPPEKVGGNTFGGIVPYIIIILCFTGAMYPAIDVTAGEKERGTMETLLCSPAARVDIVLGKFLLVLTGSLSAMALALLSMGVTGFSAGILFVSRGPGVTSVVQQKAAAGAMPMIDPMGIFGVLAMVIPVAVLFSAVEFTIGLFARSTKEAQSYIGPMMILVIAPAVIGILPGIELNTRLALVPLLNLSLVCKEMLSGVWHWNYIALIFGSSCVYAAVALGLAVKMFNREGVLFRT
jgi:sodium transport system permease protein